MSCVSLYVCVQDIEDSELLELMDMVDQENRLNPDNQQVTEPTDTPVQQVMNTAL